MSVTPRSPTDLSYAGLRMTAEEYLALGETPERYELNEGVVVVSPTPTPLHQLTVGEFLYQLGAWADARGCRAHVFPSTDLRLNARHVYRPDVSVYSLERLPQVPWRLDFPPDLIVEVLSPGSKPMDLITKREDYERFGVGEYMAADPQNGRVQRWSRQGARLVETLVEGDRLASSVLAGLWIDLGAVRRIAERFR